MKNTFKKITATVLCMGMSLMQANVLAEETVTEEKVVEEVTEEIIELTLEEAINMAHENNPLLLANDAKIKSAELSVEVAKEQKKDYADMEKAASKVPGWGMAVNVSSGLEQGYLKHGYYLLAANTGYELAVIEKEKSKATLSYDVTQKYYNVKLVEKLIKIAETTLEITCENKEVVEKSFELGLVSELEVKNVENAVKKAENSLESYKRNYLVALENLKISLQIEGDVKLVLTDEITIPLVPENEDEMIVSALNTRYDLTALKKAMELKQNLFEITDRYVGDGTAVYHSTYSDYILSKYTYENTSKLIALSLRNEYNSILDAKEAMNSCEDELEIKTVEYESDKIKYDMGIITNIELTGSMAELDGKRVQLENAKMSYLLAILKFGYNTTIGI